MSFSYKPLWKLLIDKDMTKKQLMDEVHISKSTIDKMNHEDNVSLDILDRICTYFSCEINEVVKHKKG